MKIGGSLGIPVKIGSAPCNGFRISRSFSRPSPFGDDATALPLVAPLRNWRWPALPKCRSL